MPAKKPDYFAVLGLTSDASDDVIRAAYKKLALQWHPDRHLAGKEHAAQMFIEVNTAYHALMDGKESTHSSSAETSSTTSMPTSSADTAHSDTHTKGTSQASSRAPSPSSNGSNRSNPQSSKKPPSSAPSDGQNSNTTKPSSKPKPASSKSPSSHGSSHDQKSESHSRPAKPSSADEHRSSSDRMKSGRKSSKSHDHLRDPPGPTAQKNAPPSTRSRSSEGLDGSHAPKPSKKDTRSSTPSNETKHDTRSEKTFHSRSSASHTSKPVIPPPSGRLHKPSRLGLADEFVQKLSKGATKGKKERPGNLPRDEDVPPYGSPLRAINAPRGASKEWLFPLPLTFDEMFHGTSYRFLVTRELLSRQTEQVEISIDIPPGMRSGTRIVCPRTGHQRKDGTLQDVVFLVEEVPDERFSRVKDDLYLDVCVPWEDALADQGGELCIEGMDGEEITFTLPYPIYDKATEGQVLVKGAGMPVREGRKALARGDMIIRWQVVFSNHSKWQTFKKALRIKV